MFVLFCFLVEETVTVRFTQSLATGPERRYVAASTLGSR
jgi:hypothetical protein